MPVTCICKQCGKVFHLSPAFIRLGQGKYCSHICQGKERSSHWEKRFWSHVKKTTNPDDCWLWTSTIRQGYGRFRIKDRQENAHRVAYKLAYGPIPLDMDVLHNCDNPSCVNYRHLWVGTAKQNMQDASKKGRLFFQTHPEAVPHGEKHSCAKLTEKQVIEIRSLYIDQKLSHKKLGEIYNVSSSTIGRIITRKRWTHI